MTIHELLGGSAAALVTGALGWWAHYVTSGAAKAHRLTGTVIEIQRTIKSHEEREEKKFEAVTIEIGALRDSVGKLIGSVGQLHGKVDSLVLYLKEPRLKE